MAESWKVPSVAFRTKEISTQHRNRQAQSLWKVYVVKSDGEGKVTPTHAPLPCHTDMPQLASQPQNASKSQASSRLRKACQRQTRLVYNFLKKRSIRKEHTRHNRKWTGRKVPMENASCLLAGRAGQARIRRSPTMAAKKTVIQEGRLPSCRGIVASKRI